jgi:DHA2 family multidrug resistance protein
MLHHISQFTDAATHRLAQLEQLMRSHGNSEAVSHQKALMLLDGMLRKQAAMLAFEHLFLAFGVMMLAALPLLLLMRRSQFSRQGSAADH